MPSACAAWMPAITLPSSPQRVIALNFSPVERVERDIDALDAGGAERPGETLELRAVGRDGELVERACLEVPAQRLKQADDVAPDERLAAGDAELSHALVDEGRAEPVELFQRQEIALRQERHVLGHAVDATEVAAVGDGDAQIGD